MPAFYFPSGSVVKDFGIAALLRLVRHRLFLEVEQDWHPMNLAPHLQQYHARCLLVRVPLPRPSNHLQNQKS